MKKIILVLVSRLILFLLLQILIAFFIKSWEGSIKFWPLAATLTNIVSIIILCISLKQENTTFFSLFRFQKATWKSDLIWFLILLIVSVPVAIIPSLTLSRLFWGNTEYYHQVLFQPVNRNLLYFLLIAYPVTTGLAELTTYFGYVMPRLKRYIQTNWLIIVIPVIAFSVQHCTLPLVLETKFILFRGIMYLLFALVYGIALFKRPSLLPWLVILQMLIYLLPMSMFLSL